MEFSWAYEDTMRRLATEPIYFHTGSVNDARENAAYCLMFKFDLNRDGCDIPTFVADRITSYIPTNEETVTIVIPLYTGNYQKNCAGAETMLKYFTRESSGRIHKAITPKGECYYGNNGIVLDRDFNPLLVTTVHMRFNPDTNSFVKERYTVHMHPNIFTDDTKLLNKSLAKKGIAYYLTHNAYRGWNSSYAELPYKVEIDDCSQYLMKTHKPNVSHCKDEDFNEVLKENIDEVLRQIADDNRRNL